MKIVCEYNLLVDGFQLSAGIPVEVDKTQAASLLKFPGVKKVSGELLGSEEPTPPTISVKE